MVISVLPLVFFIVRLFLAAFADFKGWRRLYLLINWPSTFFSTLIYAIANSTPFFLFGKMIEAVKESSYWSVNRTAIFSLSPKTKEKEATKNSAVLALATATGSAIAGIGISYFGFSFAIFLFLFASFIIGIPASLLWRIPKRESESKACKVKDLLNPLNRGRMFWFVSLILLFFSIARYPLLYLILPVFMVQELGYGYITIGLMYMFYNLFSSAVTFAALRTSLNAKRAIFQSSLAIFATFLVSNFLGYFPLLFLVLAISEGLCMGFFESIIAKTTKKSVCISVDIGLLHIPMRISEFLSILYAGFIAESVGYMPVFVLSGIFFFIFSISSWYFLKKEKGDL
jgi:predicted MFS family arabinose efflux permease